MKVLNCKLKFVFLTGNVFVKLLKMQDLYVSVI